jgi:NAD(P)-dependent dehydrogenase (short-subunit alcohol dehydrogenase family)
MSTKFIGHVSVVTGASTGIGFTIAQSLIAEGAKRVYITGRSEKTLKEAAAELGEAAVPVVSDVSNLSDLETLKAEIDRHGDKLDSVFANAGICEKNEMGTTSEAEFDKSFDINVKGVFFTVQSLLPLVKDSAAIVLTASICANNGMAGLSLYNASKAAVRSFARTWANDFRDRKIRVNALSPGFTFTPLFEKLGMNDAEIQAAKESTARSVPAGYMADPSEIATAALFLASQDAKYVNGIELTVDGGVSQI